MKTLKLLYITALLCAFNTSHGQAPTFEWAKGMGDANYQYGFGLAEDSNGDVLTIGYFQGTVDFDPNAGVTNLTSQGGYDIYAQKLDANGNLLWAKSVGGTNSDYGYAVTTDNSNNVYLSGRFGGTVDFDPGTGVFNLVSAGGNEIFILKLDASGNFVWAKNMGGTGSDYGRGIALDALGNVYVTGYFSGTADFDPGVGVSNLTSAGNDDIFVSKLDNSGNFVWAKRMGSTSADRAYGITFDPAGFIYTTGIFLNAVDFDPGVGTTTLTSNGGADIYIQKLDTDGNFIWARHMGSAGNDYGYGIAVDPSSNVVSTGYFVGTADFETGAGTTNLNSIGSTDIFVQKLDQSGNLTWAQQMGGTSGDVGNSITTDAVGNIYTTGFFYSTTDFDPGPGTANLSSLGIADAFIHKLDASGNFSWVQQLGGAGYNEGRSVVTNAGSLYSTGQFQQTVDFDPTVGVFNLTSAGNNDSYVHKMSLCATATGTDVLAACDTYTWIDGNTYTSNNSTATHTIVGGAANGCDSIVTLNLTINNAATGTDVIAACDSYTWIDANTYTASNSTAMHTLVGGAANGCDSIVTLNLTINNTASGTDVISACDSYTWIDANTYTTSNSTATHTLVGGAANGCDSIVTLNLTLGNSNTGTDVQSACDSYTWIDGNTYTANNSTATHTLTNINGCDSLVTLDLTILSSSAGTDVQTACDSFTWIDGNTYTSSNNTATHTISNAVGCDSIITLDLTINPLPNVSVSQTGALLTADQMGANYQWLDCDNGFASIANENNQSYTPTATGNYAVEIELNGCTDSSTCYYVDFSSLEDNVNLQLDVYPNPSTGEVVIIFTEQQSLISFNLKTITGQVIDARQYVNQTQVNYNLNQAPGIYLLEFINENHQVVITKKIVID